MVSLGIFVSTIITLLFSIILSFFLINSSSKLIQYQENNYWINSSNTTINWQTSLLWIQKSQTLKWTQNWFSTLNIAKYK